MAVQESSVAFTFTCARIDGEVMSASILSYLIRFDQSSSDQIRAGQNSSNQIQSGFGYMYLVEHAYAALLKGSWWPQYC